MSHPEQLAFFSGVAAANTPLLSGGRVLEIGSYDVNGSVREVFAAAGDYVGVDLTEGPGVDVVSFGHEYAAADESFDAAVSGECFEHDPHWRETFTNMVRLTRPGGLVAFTCASHGRPEHGTRRSDITDSPGTQAEGMDYYRNLVAADFDSLPLATWFKDYRFWYQRSTFDLYFAGVRSGEGAPVAALPSDDVVREISRMLPLVHRLIRIPLRATAAVVKDEDRYQRLVMPYWLALLRRSGGHHRAARTGDRTQ
jgi:SAM-dependent methyltransferase